MAKPNPLTKGLAESKRPKRTTFKKAGQQVSDAAINGNGSSKGSQGDQRPHRAGRVLIGGHFKPEVQTALKIICAKERCAIIDLMAEGINVIFAKRGMPEIAATPRQREE